MKKFIAFLITLVILSGITYLAVGNNFFLLNFIFQDPGRAALAINEELENYDQAKYYDLVMTIDAKEDENTQSVTIAIKLVYNEDYDGFDFIASVKDVLDLNDVVTTSEASYYYHDGVLYSKDITNDTTSQETMVYEDALDEVTSSDGLMFLSPFDILDSFSGEDYTFQVGFAYNWSPFYLGQKLSYQYQTDTYYSRIAILLDAFRNYRGMDYEIGNADETETYDIEVTVNSYDKPLTLSFPSNLDTYGA